MLFFFQQIAQNLKRMEENQRIERKRNQNNGKDSKRKEHNRKEKKYMSGYTAMLY